MGIFRRAIFDRVGLFDEDLVRNQDIELNGRIRRAGGRIVLSPRIRSTYFCRSTLRALWKQNYINGLWLFPTVAKTPKALSWRHYVPLAFVFTLLFSIIALPILPGGKILVTAVIGSYIWPPRSPALQQLYITVGALPFLSQLYLLPCISAMAWDLF